MTQCARTTLDGQHRCPNKAVVRIIMLTEFHNVIDAAACGPCAGTAMEDMRPGEHAMVKRLR